MDELQMPAGHSRGAGLQELQICGRVAEGRHDCRPGGAVHLGWQLCHVALRHGLVPRGQLLRPLSRVSLHGAGVAHRADI